MSTTAARSEKKTRTRHQNPENRPRSHPTPTLRVREYTDLALDGLPASFISDTLEFSQTVRHTEDGPTDRLTREGHNLRYAAIVALGLATVAEETQRVVLRGSTARDITEAAVVRAAGTRDPGAVALVAWAAAEVTGTPDERLLHRLARILDSGDPIPTVVASWMLTAAIASLAVDHTVAHASDIARVARDRLLTAQGPQGIFPHALPASTLGRLRAHVGCFADQVYPIQALARLAAFTTDPEALYAANLCAARICELQGEAGQWWWHYDARDGSVVEKYPVYSVHQHAMAPMALLDLANSGGDDHRDAIFLGLDWLQTHPEVDEELVAEEHSMIWRKAGRREPAKAARKLAAVTTAIHPGWHLPGIDLIFPANRVDRECRPYELGWLLYAWRGAEGVAAIEAATDDDGAADEADAS
ncbi:hypothetical protein [Leifsonia sp. 2MCAF36]|uniref:hypothetical protein n=1 Tax=Leifsonia sp. 2MCAF36 TaxID=3232988 RepID=UPI003F9AE5BC